MVYINFDMFVLLVIHTKNIYVLLNRDAYSLLKSTKSNIKTKTCVHLNEIIFHLKKSYDEKLQRGEHKNYKYTILKRIKNNNILLKNYIQKNISK